MKANILVVLLIVAFASAGLTDGQKKALSSVANSMENWLGKEVMENTYPKINFTNITQIATLFASGLLVGMLQIRQNYNLTLCFSNYAMLVQIINNVMYVIQHGLSPIPIVMIRQLLVLGVQVLNATIQEYWYCSGISGFYYEFYYTFYDCMLFCTPRFYDMMSSNIMTRSTEYLYYMEQASLAFTAGNYQNSGIWAGYVLDRVVMTNGSCSGSTRCSDRLFS